MRRWLLRGGAGLLLLASLPLALGYWLTPYASLAARVAQPNLALYGGGSPLPLAPGRYLALRLGLSVVALLAALGWRRLSQPSAASHEPRAGRALPARLLSLLPRFWTPLWQPLARLSRPQRWLALGLGLAVAGARLHYAGWYPLSLDEMASYDYCVRPGPALTASYYPFPNNHLLANLLAGAVHGLLPGASPELALRLLPTLAGLLALPLLYAQLLRYLRFGVVTLGLGWFGLSPLAVYYAVAGRGYAWALLAALAGLLAAQALLRPGGPPAAGRRLAWAVVGLSGVLGLYAVPTHAYALLGLGLSLLVGFGRQPRRQRRHNLACLALASAGIGLAAAVLYAPVGAVSGWPALLANPYVAHHAGPAFWANFGSFLVTTAAELLGQRGWSAAAYVGLLGLVPLALHWGRLPAATRRLAWLLYAQLAGWLPVAAVQGVYPPARTLLLVLFAFLLLLPLSAQALLARWAPAGSPLGAWFSPRFARARGALLTLLVLAYGGYRLAREQVVLALRAREQAGLRRDEAWLRTQALRRVWVEPRAYAIFWHHAALQAGRRPLPLLVVDDARGARPAAAGARPAEVEVLASPPAPARPAQPVLYQSPWVAVVPVSAAQPLLVLP